MSASADGLDPIIHAPARLRITAALAAGPPGQMLAFKRLRDALGLTDGNLGAHLTTLEGAGYVAVTKDFVGKRPRTRVALTAAGRHAYALHVAALRAILDHDRIVDESSAAPTRQGPAGPREETG